MKATRFEYRHQTLVHLMLVGVSLLAYLRDRVDIVWALVRGHSDSASWERLVFGFGAVLLLASALLETSAYAYPIVPEPEVPRSPMVDGIGSLHKRYLARILLVLALGLLLPLSGTIILLAGETILILRLFLHDDASVPELQPVGRRTGAARGPAFRAAASKWGLTASMILFVWTLQDRVAEIGALCSVTLWLVLSVSPQNRSGPVD
jgi:hypothetical protein